MYQPCYSCPPYHTPSIDHLVNDARGLPPTQYFTVNLQQQPYTSSVHKIVYFNQSYLDIMTNMMSHYTVSMLEYHLQRIQTNKQAQSAYHTSNYTTLSSYTTLSNGFIHLPEQFLHPNRPKTKVIDHIDASIKRAVEKTFQLLCFEPMQNIAFAVLPQQEFKKAHAQFSHKWSDGIVGFAINRSHLYDVSQIFIKAQPLDALMLTIGHEIGHCLSAPHHDPIMEEAKAFAFELAWMEIIHTHNILGLQNHMNTALLLPANNGLHDTALYWVRKQLGKLHPFALFKKLKKN